MPCSLSSARVSATSYCVGSPEISIDSYPNFLMRRSVVSSGSARIQLCVDRCMSCLLPEVRLRQLRAAALCVSTAVSKNWCDQFRLAPPLAHSLSAHNNHRLERNQKYNIEIS